jgi:outer membrane beta-barrel protein
VFRASGAIAVALTLTGGLAPPAQAAPGNAAPVRLDPTAAGSPFQTGDAERDDEGTDSSAAGGEDEEDSESSLHALTCLDGDAMGGGRRKGVQKRDFLKRHRFELSGLGGFYASDTLSSTYSYGGALAFFPSEDFGLELLVTRSPVKFRLEEPFSAFDRERHFVGGTAWQAMASLMWSLIHAKLRFSDASIVHSDFFIIAGAGKTWHDSVQGLTWEVGAGIKLYLSRFVNLRIDLRDFLLPQEVLGRGRITNNVTVLAGVSFWL